MWPPSIDCLVGHVIRFTIRMPDKTLVMRASHVMGLADTGVYVGEWTKKRWQVTDFIHWSDITEVLVVDEWQSGRWANPALPKKRQTAAARGDRVR